jgi:hypothetical protein
MKKLERYKQVRVIKLIQKPEAYDGWKLNKRTPQIGDLGTLVDFLKVEGLPDMYIVETSDKNGQDIWLSDFYEEEIESTE